MTNFISYATYRYLWLKVCTLFYLNFAHQIDREKTSIFIIPKRGEAQNSSASPRFRYITIY